MNQAIARHIYSIAHQLQCKSHHRGEDETLKTKVRVYGSMLGVSFVL